jgi:calcineurin-like phosphoesterase family protein
MLNIWFTADFHLGHKNIIRYCNRPFGTVEEMNRTILDRLNNLVKANDILYFLGTSASVQKQGSGVTPRDSM